MASTESRELWARVGAGAVFVGAAALTLAQMHSMSAGMPRDIRMPGGWVMSMFWVSIPGHSAASTMAMFLAMWLAMMIAIMLPSSWPVFELYQRTAASAGQMQLALPTLVVGAGYFAVWMAFGALVFLAGRFISSEAMRYPMFSYAVPLLAGLRPDFRRHLSGFAVEADVPAPLPFAADVPRTSVPTGPSRRTAGRPDPWSFLPRMLLGIDADPIHPGRHEPGRDDPDRRLDRRGKTMDAGPGLGPRDGSDLHCGGNLFPHALPGAPSFLMRLSVRYAGRNESPCLLVYN